MDAGEITKSLTGCWSLFTNELRSDRTKPTASLSYPSNFDLLTTTTVTSAAYLLILTLLYYCTM